MESLGTDVALTRKYSLKKFAIVVVLGVLIFGAAIFLPVLVRRAVVSKVRAELPTTELPTAELPTAELPTTELTTLYEPFTNSGLKAPPEGFELNGHPIRIVSGSIHYFRVMPEYWRDRLRKLRACGLNTVDTYVPWNLHNPEPGKYDFGAGGTDMSAFLDVEQFIRLAQKENLLVILRPGPYICADLDFGGLPSWLLRDPNMKVRTSDPSYTSKVKEYFDQLIPRFKKLQFGYGGPIIAVQLENEYGYFRTLDKEYLMFLKSLLEGHGISGLFFTGDVPLRNADMGALPGVLQAANFNQNPSGHLKVLKNLQPDKPVMVIAYWTGWYDLWMGTHHITTLEQYTSILEQILDFAASVNLYMFHGGTNWGFMNGAIRTLAFPTYRPIATSFDYDAPLTEAGDYTEKYWATKKMVARYLSVTTRLPEPPLETTKVAYPSTSFMGQLTLDDIVLKTDPIDTVNSYHVLTMEALPINNGAGQSYGLILYRKTNVTVHNHSTLQVMGHIRDVGLVLLDGERQTEPLTNQEQLKGFGYWEQKDATLTLSNPSNDTRTLDILVENWGRDIFSYPEDYLLLYKGIVSGPIMLDGVELNDWAITALQFKKKWINSLQGWQLVTTGNLTTPTLFRAVLSVTEPHDTFLDMREWGKGIVFINGFTLGRYFQLGPTRTLYLPAPLLRQGDNEILVFELFSAASRLKFTKSPIVG